MGQSRNNGGQDYYMCANPTGHGGLSIKRQDADDYVARQVWERLARAGMGSEEDLAWAVEAALRLAAKRGVAGVLEERRRETAARLEHVRSSIAELQADREAGLYRGGDELAMWRATMAQYRAFEDQCAARLEGLNEETATATRIPPEWLAPPEDPLGPESAWASWAVLERRAFVELFLTGVAVGPGRDPQTRKLIPVDDRLGLDWRPVS